MIMNPRMSRQCLMAMVILGLVGWAAASPAFAESVTFKVLAIRATNEEKPHIDPELEPVKDALTLFHYNSFRVAAKQRVAAETGKTTEVALIEDFAVRLEPQEVTEKGVKVVATMIHYEKDKDGKRIARVLERASMTIRRGKFLLRGGWGLKEGVLVTLVAAE
jgi:hypothetical protein